MTAAPHRPGDDASAPNALTLDAVTHRYADHQALDDVGLRVRVGERLALVGPNGSGKSTLLNLAAGRLQPTAGRVAWPALATDGDAMRVRARLGVVFQHPAVDVELSARENLVHHGRLFGFAGAEVRRRADALLQTMDLADRARDPVAAFSGGMRRRVELAKALMSDPRLLIMDEPTVGLDLAARRDWWRMLEDWIQRRGATLILTTHLMQDAERCDRMVLLDRGRIVADAAPGDLSRRVGETVMSVRPTPSGDEAAAEEIARRLDEALGPWSDEGARPRRVDRVVRCEPPDPQAAAAEAIRLLGDRVAEVRLGQPSLDDVFIHFTGRPVVSASHATSTSSTKIWPLTPKPPPTSTL